MTDKLREAAQQALEAMRATHYEMIDAGILYQDLLNKNFTAHEAIKAALAEQPAEQESVRGEWQGYTWNPYAVPQPKAEPLTNLEGLKLAYNHHWINNLSLRDAFLQGIRDAEAAHGITKE